MEYEAYDSSGTDDDLPPSHQNRVPRGGRLAGNGGSAFVGSVPYMMHNDMEAQIHLLEQEAYSSVLRAFKAQSDAISWEKEDLITNLRKELRLSDDDHRELLGRVNADDIIRRIRKWRQSAGHQPCLLSAQPLHEPIPSPTVSASRKKAKTSQSVPTLPPNAPSPKFHLETVAPQMQPSSSAAKRGSAGGARGKKLKPVRFNILKPKWSRNCMLTGILFLSKNSQGQTLASSSGMKSMQHPSRGPTARGQFANRASSGALVVNEPAEAAAELIGRRVMTRWPADNNYYEAVITNYNPDEGRHALVYDMNTADETWEWVNLKEIPPEDIRWEGEVPDLSHLGAHDGQGRGFKKSVGRGGAVPSAGRGRGGTKGQSKKDIPPLQNGIGRKASDDIEILHTDSLIKEVERVFGASHPDPLEIEKAKKVLKEHEQALIDAIARLADASDGESDEGERPFSHGQSMDQDKGWRNRTYGVNQTGCEDDAGGRGEAPLDADRMVAE